MEKLLLQDALQRRNTIKCILCRLKGYRRIATPYDKLAAKFLGAIYLAVAVT